jgi:hypothetical protein
MEFCEKEIASKKDSRVKYTEGFVNAVRKFVQEKIADRVSASRKMFKMPAYEAKPRGKTKKED